LKNLAAGLEAVHRRHHEIEDGDVGFVGLREPHRFLSVGRLGDDLEALALEEHAESLSHDVVVVGTGVFMLLYLDLAYKQAREDGRMRSAEDLHHAIMQGAVKRLRPKFMTVATMFVGLVPIMWATGTGADVMKRIAAPMIGGILTSFLMELVVYPPLYQLWKWHGDVKSAARIA